jgi:hypothetical protein
VLRVHEVKAVYPRHTEPRINEPDDPYHLYIELMASESSALLVLSMLVMVSRQQYDTNKRTVHDTYQQVSIQT